MARGYKQEAQRLLTKQIETDFACKVKSIKMSDHTAVLQFGDTKEVNITIFDNTYIITAIKREFSEEILPQSANDLLDLIDKL